MCLLESHPILKLIQCFCEISCLYTVYLNIILIMGTCEACMLHM